jgi:hypothetical protein
MPYVDHELATADFFEIRRPADCDWISYSILIITLRRTLGQRLAGIFMGLAFVLPA